MAEKSEIPPEVTREKVNYWIRYYENQLEFAKIRVQECEAEKEYWELILARLESPELADVPPLSTERESNVMGPLREERE